LTELIVNTAISRHIGTLHRAEAAWLSRNKLYLANFPAFFEKAIHADIAHWIWKSCIKGLVGN